MVTSERDFADLDAREQTRIVLLYSLRHQLPLDMANNVPLSRMIPFGRFISHMETSADILPTVVFETYLDQAIIRIKDERLPGVVDSVRIILTITRRCDAVLLIEINLSDSHAVDEIIKILAMTCFDRWFITVDGTPILRWLHNQIIQSHAIDSDDFEFGRDVHQMVFPSRVLAQRLTLNETLLRAEVSRIIYRGTLTFTAPFYEPSTLNYPGCTLTAHGRGVSVVAGWGMHVENTFLVVAMTLISSLGVLQRTRQNAFTALKLNDNVHLASTADARTLIARLASQLTDMQLDLSFGVEAFIDSVLIPELLVGSFQASLREAVGVTDALDNTSRMLTRLQAVINARLQTLETAVQQEQERRSKAISYVFAIGTLIAAPPALLLAFFGVNATEVHANDSMFDFQRYWPAYAVAWLPFIALILVGWLFWRTVRHVPSTPEDGATRINQEIYSRFDSTISR